MRLFLRSLLFTFFAVALVNLHAFSQTATIKTDQLDYPPGATVIITGTGWQPGETVTLQVLHEGEAGDNATSGAHAPFTAIADPNGNVSSMWIVPLDEDELGATLLLTADGVSSGRHAECTFTDANIAFTATGLPPNSSCTVIITYWTVPPKNGQSQQVTTTPQLISVNNGGSASSINIPANPGSIITWAYSDASGYVYTSSSYNNGTPVNESTGFTVNGNQTGASAVIGNYIACTAPSITNQPTDQVTTYGQGSQTFSITATGNVSGYQWQVLTTTPGAVWTDISSAISSSYTVASPTVAMSGYQYRVRVSGTCTPAVTSNAVTLTVNKKNIIITPNAGQSKVYGNPDPTFTYSASEALQSGDSYSGALGRASGESVASSPYAYTMGTLSAGTNYSLTLGGSNTFAITARPVTITADPKTKVYGDADPALTYKITSGSLAFSDAFTGSLTRDAGENVGQYNITQGSVALSSNYTLSYVGDKLTITARPVTITADPKSKVYGDADPALTYKITSGSLAFSDAFTGSLTRDAGENVGQYNITEGSVALSSNYTLSYVGDKLTITARPITITPDLGQFKYCGQPDPTFTYTGSEQLLPVNSYSGALGRLGTNDVGTYNYTLGTLSAGNNYTLTLAGTNTFEIKGVSIDASNTSTAIQLGTASKTLTATVTSGATIVPNATVTFTITNNGNINPIIVTAITNASGVATYNLPSGTLTVGLYQVTAVAGSGCSTSIAYFSVYDPNAGFVTGGGWINSPAGAYSPDPSLTGKANFGFNAQYKKGNNTPDGNTEFQFQAGNLNFKSTNYATGSLVIAGAKAIFQGTGTINGSGSYSFMISAIDGSISGGGGVDKFRIKIQTAGGGVVYDNNVNAPNNAEPTTCLGGGSIVIHSTGNTKRTMDTVKTGLNVSMLNPNNANEQEGTGKLSIQVMPNPTSYHFTLILKSLSKENVKVTVTDITGRVVEQRSSVAANSTLQLGSQYHPGIYIAEFIQGTDRITLRLIKEGK